MAVGFGAGFGTTFVATGATGVAGVSLIFSLQLEFYCNYKLEARGVTAKVETVAPVPGTF